MKKGVPYFGKQERNSSQHCGIQKARVRANEMGKRLGEMDRDTWTMDYRIAGYRVAMRYVQHQQQVQLRLSAATKQRCSRSICIRTEPPQCVCVYFVTLGSPEMSSGRMCLSHCKRGSLRSHLGIITIRCVLNSSKRCVTLFRFSPSENDNSSDPTGSWEDSGDPIPIVHV